MDGAGMALHEHFGNTRCISEVAIDLEWGVGVEHSPGWQLRPVEAANIPF